MSLTCFFFSSNHYGYKFPPHYLFLNALSKTGSWVLDFWSLVCWVMVISDQASVISAQLPVPSNKKTYLLMSIPKEPRQLMINLMYLVLTAMLALNVSAEVLHAFMSMDKSLNQSSSLVGNSNDQLLNAISAHAEAYSQYEPYKVKAAQVQKIAKTFHNYVAKLKDNLIEQAGGLAEDGLPKRKSDKDITTRFLVKEGNGELLEKEILETRGQLLNLIEDPELRKRLVLSIPLNVEDIPKDSDKKTWSQFKFQQMPVAAVLPMLSKFQHDTKIAETAILNHFSNEINASTTIPDAFEPVIATDKSYVIRGEEFRGEIFLAAYSSTADNISVSVDGRSFPVENGKAVFASNPNSIGTKNHEMIINLENPLTGEVKTFKKDFSYEVGDRSVAVSLDKMNVLYVGVDNPITISAAGTPSGQIRVSSKGVELRKNGNGKFIAKPSETGKASITVSGGGLKPTIFEYKVKRIPDPVLMLGTKKGGSMTPAEMAVQPGIIPMLENFHFNAKCKIDEFEVARVRKGDVAATINRGGRFGTAAKRLTEKAQREDIFYFDEVYALCPGDKVRRKLPGMLFKIK